MFFPKSRCELLDSRCSAVDTTLFVHLVVILNNAFEFVLGVSGTTDIGKKKILLLKGKEKEIPHVRSSFSPFLFLVNLDHP